MLRELKNHNPKHVDRLIEYYRLKHRNLSEHAAIDELEYMLEKSFDFLNNYMIMITGKLLEKKSEIR